MAYNSPIRLYQFLSEKVGSEDAVRTRRLLYSIVDYVCSTKHFVRMTSGSKGEGLDMRGSDLDVMIVLNNINIYKFPPDNCPQDSFVMSTKSTKPGFTHLQVCGKMNPILQSLCASFDNHFFLSSKSLKLFLTVASNVGSPPFSIKVHGPCLSPVHYSEDYAVSFRCRSWIRLAHQWVTRNRFWPSSDLVSKITDFGVLFVPIGCKGSPNEFLEWRISFSAAEKLLIHSFSHTQLLCYALLKLLLKDIIEKNEFCKGLLCSYFLKTIVFWESESFPVSEWKPANIVSCFMKVFKRLLYYVEYNHLPHYFITDSDLFENRFSLEQHTTLKNELSRLYQKGIYCMEESNTLSRYFYAIKQSLNHSLTTDKINLMEKLNILIRNQQDDFMTMFLMPKRAPAKLLNFQIHNRSELNRFLFLTIMYDILQILGSKYIIRSTSNKHHYKDGYKQYFPYLVCGRKTDAVSGWLFIASYFYKMKRFQIVLDIVDHVLQKCTPDKLVHQKGSYVLYELSDLNDKLCKSHYNAGDVFRRNVVRYPQFYFLYSIIIPELEELRFFSDLPPKVYAMFLKFLCFHQLSDFPRLLDTLMDLQLNVGNIHIDSWSEATSNICLGISYYMIGEYKKANLCFKHASKMGNHDLQYFRNIYGRIGRLQK